MRRGAASFAFLALIGCGADAPSGVTPPVDVASFVRLASDPGETLGAGATFDYSKADALVTVRSLGAQLAVRVVGDRVWDGFLDLSSDEPRLRAGTFAALTNTPALRRAGFRWSSQETTCVASVATVTIDSVKYDGETLRAIDLRFEQRCDGQSAALRGTVHWRAADDVNASGPLLPVPTALWRAPAGSTPTTGSYAYLTGEAPGSGVTLPLTIVPPPGRMGVTTTPNRLSILAPDPAIGLTMTAIFQHMLGTTAVQEGYYRDLRGLSEDLNRGGLGVALNGPGCDSLVGWFAIDHVFYFQGNLTTIDLRFELRCNGFAAPLRGQVHWAE